MALTALSQHARIDSVSSFSVFAGILEAQLITKPSACVSPGARCRVELAREALVYKRSSWGFCDSGIGLAAFFPRRFGSASARLELSKCARISLARSRTSLGKPARRAT